MIIEVDISLDKHRTHFVDADLTDGVLRWKSNGRVPFDDVLEKVFRMHPELNYTKCKAARDADNAAFFSEYRKNYKGPSDEERFEARAAFGPGKEITNIITGHRWKT